MFKLTYLKSVFLYGILAGVLTLVYCLVVKSMGVIPLDGKKAPSILLSGFCMALAVWSCREKNEDKVIHFWECLFIANLTNLVGACISATGLYFWLSADMSMIQDFIAESLRVLTLPNVKEEYVKDLGEAVYNQAIQGFKMLTPKDLALDEIKGLKGKLPLGFFMSMMIAIYFKRHYITPKVV